MLSALFYAFAILTHESAIFFPVIAFAYVMIFEAAAVSGHSSCPPGTHREHQRAYRQRADRLHPVPVRHAGLRLRADARRSAITPSACPTQYTEAQMHGVAGAVPIRGAAQIAMTIPMVLLTYLGILAIPGVANPFHSIEWTTQLDPQVFIAWAALHRAGIDRDRVCVAQLAPQGLSLLRHLEPRHHRARAQDQFPLVAEPGPLRLCAVVRMEPRARARPLRNFHRRRARSSRGRHRNRTPAAQLRHRDHPGSALLV